MECAAPRRLRCHSRLWAALAAVLVCAPVQAQQERPDPDAPAAALAVAIREVLSAPQARPPLDAQQLATLRPFYAARGHRPLWTAPSGLLPPGTMLAQRLAAARDAGQAAVAPFAEALARIRPTSPALLAEAEALLSAGLLAGAVDPQDPTRPADGATLLAQAASAPDMLRILRRHLPIDPAFWRLRGAIPTYRAIAAAGGWPTLPSGPRLESSVADGRVRILRRRLAMTGDLAAGEQVGALFDTALDAAVRRFQARHGLLVDGIVGPRTLAALNVPAGQRLATMILNLERLYRQTREWGRRYVAVNIPAAQYRLVEGGRELFERPAIVGRRDWPTPEIQSTIDRLEFHPYWVVPPRIARLEVLPKIHSDPGYMQRHDMHYVDGQIRQDPGPANPLGLVKFIFPNPYDVYLHDTNRRELFERADRFLSHGCIRVSGALDLAARLLADDPQWTPQRLDSVVQAGRNLRVALARPIPIHVVYDTAWVDEEGVLQFREDVYRRDPPAPSTVLSSAPVGSCAG